MEDDLFLLAVEEEVAFLDDDGGLRTFLEGVPSYSRSSPLDDP